MPVVRLEPSHTLGDDWSPVRAGKPARGGDGTEQGLEGARLGEKKAEEGEGRLQEGLDLAAMACTKSYPLVGSRPTPFLLDLHQQNWWHKSKETHCRMGDLWRCEQV